MSDSREEAARRFAEAIGCEWIPAIEADRTSIPWSEEYGVGVFRITHPGVGSNEVDGFPQTADTEDLIYLPYSDAQLHVHLEFVGRVVEALEAMEGDDHTYLIECGRVFDGWTPVGYRVGIYYRSGDDNKSEAPDPSWAAMLTAIAARRMP